MGQFLIDSNIISGYFSGMFSAKAMNFIAGIIDQMPTVSVITEIEALSWVSPDKTKEEIVKAFIEDSNVLPLSQEVIAECIRIRRSRKVKTPDAIIAATAIVHSLTLITYDSDFNHIQDLKIINPDSL